MRVVITIPAYNEERTIGRVIREIREVMNSTNFNYQILVLNDGSGDRTVKIAEKEGAIVAHNKKNLGLAETFKHEMRMCLKFDKVLQ